MRSSRPEAWTKRASARFSRAIDDFDYEGTYTTVYPIKVNQQRHVVQEIVEFGEPFGVGLECGSKPELMAVLALHESTNQVIVCNGYKDEEFMRLALIGQQLGHRVVVVLEQVSELDVLLPVAAEMGINAKLAKRAGLLHDIGKVYPEEAELPHAILGMELAMKYKEHPEVINAIGAHHDEIEMTSMLSPIVQACDAISGSRPGARREIMDSYIKRLKDLENLALSFDGVNKCFAMQAGRELRVLVDADNVDDATANQLSFDISQKIEKEMQYPGQIKITVIREMRSVSYAK